MELNVEELWLLKLAIDHAIDAEREFINCNMVNGECVSPTAVRKSRGLIRRWRQLRERVNREEQGMKGKVDS